MKCVCGQMFEGTVCPNCGRQYPPTTRCSCGCEYDIGFGFCPNCGRPNAAYGNAAPDYETAYAPFPYAQGQPHPQAPPYQREGAIRSFFRKIGVGAVIVWALALLLLLGGYLIPAILFAAGGACICLLLKDKLSAMLQINSKWMYLVMAVLLFCGLVTTAYYDEEESAYTDSGYAQSGYTQPVRTDFYVGDNVNCGNWSIQINSVKIDNIFNCVMCSATVTNNTGRNQVFDSGSLLSLNNGGILDDAWCYEDYDTVASYASFDTTLYFYYSPNMNKDLSEMTMDITGSKNKIHLG